MSYNPGVLPQQKEPDLKNALERELRKIKDGINEVNNLISDYVNKTDGKQQVIDNDVVFNQGFTFTDDIAAELDSVGVHPVVSFEKAKNVYVPRLAPTAPMEDQNAATKGYVDLIVNAAKTSTDFASFKAAIIAAFP